MPSFFYGVKKALCVIKEPPAGVNDVLLDSRFRGNDTLKKAREYCVSQKLPVASFGAQSKTAQTSKTPVGFWCAQGNEP